MSWSDPLNHNLKRNTREENVGIRIGIFQIESNLLIVDAVCCCTTVGVIYRITIAQYMPSTVYIAAIHDENKQFPFRNCFRFSCRMKINRIGCGIRYKHRDRQTQIEHSSFIGTHESSETCEKSISMRVIVSVVLPIRTRFQLLFNQRK